MILYGEEDESLRILLKERLIGLVRLDSAGNSRLGGFLCWLDLSDASLAVLVDDLRLGGDFFGRRVVLLVGAVKVKLFDRRLHLQVVNSRSSLEDAAELVTVRSARGRRDALRWVGGLGTYLLGRGDLSSHCERGSVIQRVRRGFGDKRDIVRPNTMRCLVPSAVCCVECGKCGSCRGCNCFNSSRRKILC